MASLIVSAVVSLGIEQTDVRFVSPEPLDCKATNVPEDKETLGDDGFLIKDAVLPPGSNLKEEVVEISQ